VGTALGCKARELDASIAAQGAHRRIWRAGRMPRWLLARRWQEIKELKVPHYPTIPICGEHLMNQQPRLALAVLICLSAFSRFSAGP